MVIVVDTREKKPYGFEALQLQTIHKALPAGDYSIEGHETKVAVERKTLSDFISTVIHQRERFFKELNKLSHYDHVCIVVEADYQQILSGQYRSKVHPNALIGTIAAIIIDFTIPVFFCSDREAACRFTAAYLMRYYKRILPCNRNAS